MTDCNPRKQPFGKSSMIELKESRDREEFLDAARSTAHREFVGECNWIAQTTAPFLAPYMSMLGKYNSNPVAACEGVHKQILRYLKSQIGKCLTATNEEGIRYYSDTDYAGLFEVDGDPRCRVGALVTYNGMTVGWKSGWIKPGAWDDTEIKLSSGEAETSGAAEALKLCKYVKNLADDMMVPVPGRINLQVDATAAIGFADNTQCKSKMKHVNMKWHWVQSLREREVVRLIKIAGTDNPADAFTKILNGPAFRKIQDQYMVART